MNRRFSGKLLAVLISLVALLCTVSAKDYSVTAGNWQVDFRTNDTLYTETERRAPEASMVSGYIIWIERFPAVKESTGGFIYLSETTKSLPHDKDSVRSYVKNLISLVNTTPILSDYLIDGTDAVIAEGWDDKLGEIEYGAIYPIDIDQNGYTTRSVIFSSYLDKKTTFEILDSLHVEYTGYMPTQTSASATSYNRANQGGSTITTNDLLTAVKQVEPSIDKISMVIGPTNIDVTFTQREGSTNSDNTGALAAILQMYATVLKLDPTYNGYLRISQAEKGRAIATYEATAYQTRSNTDKAGLLSIDYMNQVLSRGKSITYYMSDGYGDVTKAVEVPGGRAGPSQGSWL